MRLHLSFMFPLAMVTAPVAAQSAPAPAPSPNSSKPISLFEALGMKAPGLRGAELEAALKAAEGQPLGTLKNPVRTRGVMGQRSYLSRLRCADGKAPKILGRATSYPSPFGGVGDVYTVTCKDGGQRAIEMDMYHEHVETRPVSGFTIVAP